MSLSYQGKSSGVPAALRSPTGAAAGLVLWAACIWLVLQVQHVESNSQHTVCGPWGCGPPLNVLVACHGFWFVLLVPLLAIACRILPARRQTRIGMMFALAGAIVVGGIGAWEATHWLQRASDFHRQFFLQRWLFRVGTLVDIPVIEVFLCGVLLAVHGSTRARRRSLPNNAADQRGSGSRAGLNLPAESPGSPADHAEDGTAGAGAVTAR